ncbi:MAG: lactate racemase domain-containing protein [Trueperaceae bacterium]|nr:lactate racemase domain-containing protein [Trueperaceae bacterium]
MANPLGRKPIRSLVDGRSKVVIGFPDRVKGGFHETSHRRVAIPLILEELERAGVKDENIKLVCGIGLHRMNTPEEFASYLGDDLVKRFRTRPPRQPRRRGSRRDGGPRPDGARRPCGLQSRRVRSRPHHHAGPHHGESRTGVQRRLQDAVYGVHELALHQVSSHAGNDVPGRSSCPSATESHFRHQLRSIGRKIESEMNKDFFLVDAVLNGRSEQMQVVAGAPDEVERSTWPKASTRTDVTVDGPKRNVLVLGIPGRFTTGPAWASEPHPDAARDGLVGRADRRGAGRRLRDHRARPICDGWFNHAWFPAYEAIYDKLQDLNGAHQLTAFEEEFAPTRSGSTSSRREYAYHPFHGFSMAYMGSLATRNALGTYVVGAKKPGYARGMGCTPADSFEDALARAERLLRSEPRMPVVPAVSKPAVHVTGGRRLSR